MQQAVLEMKNITKVYPNGIVANKNVHFSVKAGEIHGLLGENGAGKSTLMKILYGIDTCEEGTIFINGKEVSISSPLDSITQGVGMVHQHFMLIESLTIAENIMLGNEIVRNGLLDKNEMVRVCEEFTEKYNFKMDCSKKIYDISVGMKQKVEIIKALYKGIKVLILDEPTAILTPQETSELFAQLFKLKENGFTIIFISHKLDEIKQLCDRITIMRQGRSVGTYEVSNISKEEISNLMVGREVVLKIEKEKARPTDVVLEIRDLSVRNTFGSLAVNSVSFDVRRGEILGIAGVEGNGQQELVGALTGTHLYTGDVEVNNHSLKGLTIKKLMELGIGHIPEDRMETGIAKTLSIRENIVSNILNNKKISTGIFVNRKASKEYVNEIIKEYQIVCYSSEQEVGMLSGGNIQKVVVARELQNDLELLIANQPTRGVDVGASEFIRRKIISCRDKNTAVLMVSADLNEIFEVCDSVIVMYKGEIVAYFPNLKDLDEKQLGEYMLGVKRQEDLRGVIHAK